MDFGRQNTCVLIASAFISARSGSTLSFDRFPDRDHSKPAVDAVFLDELGAEYAFEHTIIQAFPEQIEDGTQFSRFVDDLQRLTQGKLPKSGRFVLFLRPYVTRGHVRTDFTSLADWVIEEAGKLPVKPPPFPVVFGGPPKLPFEVFLSRWEMAPHGQLAVVQTTSDEWRKEQIAGSVKEALRSHLPKLLETAAHGARTVLVLQRVDLGHTSAYAIASCLANLHDSDPRALPDWIFLIEDTFSETWGCWILKDPRGVWPDVLNPGPWGIPIGALGPIEAQGAAQ